MPAKLPDLPNDLIDAICIHLSPSDLRSIRLVNPTLSRKSLRFFGLNCFKTLSTSLSTSSLDSLQLITDNEKLAHNVTTLRLKPQTYANDNGKLKFGDGFDWPRYDSGYVRFPTEGSQLLQEVILRGLPNCKSFDIRGRTSEENPTYGELSDTDAISIILDLVAQTGLAIKSLKVELADNDSWGRRTRYRRPRESSPDTKDKKTLSPSLFQQALFRQGWQQIEALYFQRIDTVKWDWMKEMILLASNLKRLSLVFGDKPNANWLNELADQSLRLESLHLENWTNMTATCLFELLRNSKETLKEISFHNVRTHETGTWKNIVHGLGADFGALQSFSANSLHEQQVDVISPTYTRTRTAEIWFDLYNLDGPTVARLAGIFGGETEPDRPNRATSIKYTGVGMAEALYLLGNTIRH